MNSKCEVVFLVATNPRDHQQASALKAGFDQLGMQVVLITPPAYVKEEMVGLAQEIAEIGQKASVIIFQSSLLTILCDHGDYFPFYNQPYPVLSIWEQEPLPYLFYLKDYVGKNHQLVSMNAINQDFYAGLGFENWEIVPPFLWFPVTQLPVKELTARVCYRGSIPNPDSIQNPIMGLAKTFQLKSVLDTLLSEASAKRFLSNGVSLFQDFLTVQSVFNPVTFFGSQFIFGIAQLLTAVKYSQFITELSSPLYLFGECCQTPLVESGKVIIMPEFDRSCISWLPVSALGCNAQSLLADMAMSPWFIAEYSSFWDTHFPQWPASGFIFDNLTNFSRRYFPLASVVQENQDACHHFRESLADRFSPIRTARAIQGVLQ